MYIFLASKLCNPFFHSMEYLGFYPHPYDKQIHTENLITGVSGKQYNLIQTVLYNVPSRIERGKIENYFLPEITKYIALDDEAEAALRDCEVMYLRMNP